MSCGAENRSLVRPWGVFRSITVDHRLHCVKYTEKPSWDLDSSEALLRSQSSGLFTIKRVEDRRRKKSGKPRTRTWRSLFPVSNHHLSWRGAAGRSSCCFHYACILRTRAIHASPSFFVDFLLTKEGPCCPTSPSNFERQGLFCVKFTPRLSTINTACFKSRLYMCRKARAFVRNAALCRDKAKSTQQTMWITIVTCRFFLNDRSVGSYPCPNPNPFDQRRWRLWRLRAH